MHEIWTEKYRPKTFDDIKGQEHIVAGVRAFVERENMPHLLFAGPAGVGKTTLSLVLARELFGPTWRQNTLELNASDERGIDVVRHKVKDFARTKAIGNVPFKIIYLDECDALTKDAQHALRRTMENYTTTCRFILSCNYASKIIDPIQSRCTIFKFKPLQKQQIFALIDIIASKESLTLDDAAKDALFEASGGDCRRLENIMQSCAALQTTITAEKIFEIGSTAKPDTIKEVITHAVSGSFIKARDLLLDTMLQYGLSGVDVIRQIEREVWNVDIDEKTKLRFIDVCGDIEFRMVEGADDFIQLESLLAKLAIIGQEQ